jgi:hypothetical protein
VLEILDEHEHRLLLRDVLRLHLRRAAELVGGDAEERAAGEGEEKNAECRMQNAERKQRRVTPLFFALRSAFCVLRFHAHSSNWYCTNSRAISVASASTVPT